MQKLSDVAKNEMMLTGFVLLLSTRTPPLPPMVSRNAPTSPLGPFSRPRRSTRARRAQPVYATDAVLAPPTLCAQTMTRQRSMARRA